MRLVFAGTPEPALPALAALLASDRHEVVGVLTRPDAPAGRGRRLVAGPVKALAEQHGLPVLTPTRLADPAFLAELAALGADGAAVVAYGALIPPVALAALPRGWVNLHFSVLPAWRGAAPVQHALLAGDPVTGASTFLLEAGLDTGPVLGVLTEAVRVRDTAGDLLARLAEAGARLLVDSLDAWGEGLLEPQPQPAEGVSLAPKITVADAELDFAQAAWALDRRIRACTPSPGAWTTFRGLRLKVGPALPSRDGPRLAPGELVVEGTARVGTGDGTLELGTVQPAGRGPMPALDWARGIRPLPGETLGGEPS